ncbi:MAG: hypothetical protein PHZ07_05360 [Patescibacteria group bacterium]|nr:hypothetical protein [Patescibacteria group bacterium]MDD4304855.1 hypothetical protein [Patescibacteria group bacterium]MDD4695827.1 hypothetical protein [Patescibacteria group bacterium]
MKYFLYITLVITLVLTISCNAPRKITGENGGDEKSLGVKGALVTPGHEIYYKCNFFGYQSQATDSLRYLGIVDNSGAIEWSGRIPFGAVDIRFFSKNPSTGSYDYLNPLGIYARQGDTITNLSHIMHIENDHANGHPIAWGIATQFQNNPGGVNPLQETPTTSFTLEWTGIPHFTYVNGSLVELPDSTVTAYTETVPNGTQIWTQNTYGSFLPHLMNGNTITGTIPKTGYFSFLIKQESGTPLLMGINITTPYGACEAMNSFDYYIGSGDNIEHFIVFLIRVNNGAPSNVEYSDFRFGSWWTIGINGTYQISPEYITNKQITNQIFQEEK